MKQYLKQELSCAKFNLLLPPCATVLGWLFGLCSVALITYSGVSKGSWACMGTLIGLGIMIPVFLLQSCTIYRRQFQTAVSMGQTRKSFAVYFLLRQLIESIVSFGLLALCHRIEMTIFSQWYTLEACEISLDFLFHPVFSITIIAGCTLFSVLFGAIYTRFGPNSYSVLAFSYLAVCISMTLWDRLSCFLALIPMSVWGFCMISVFAVCLYVIIRLESVQMVND